MVPLDWEGGYFAESFWGTHEEWVSVEPEYQPQPYVSVELVDANETYLEGNSAKARFRIVAHDLPAGQTITVQYALQGMSAAAGVDFVEAEGDYAGELKGNRLFTDAKLQDVPTPIGNDLPPIVIPSTMPGIE